MIICENWIDFRGVDALVAIINQESDSIQFLEMFGRVPRISHLIKLETRNGFVPPIFGALSDDE